MGALFATETYDLILDMIISWHKNQQNFKFVSFDYFVFGKMINRYFESVGENNSILRSAPQISDQSQILNTNTMIEGVIRDTESNEYGEAISQFSSNVNNPESEFFVNSVDSSTDMRCPKCRYVANDLRNLKRHFSNQHRNKFLHCPWCHRAYRRKDKFRFHLIKSHNLSENEAQQRAKLVKHKEPDSNSVIVDHQLH